MEKFKTLFADCILILDGADEVSMIEGIHSTGMEDLIVSIRKIFKNNKIIITSRPQFIDISCLTAALPILFRSCGFADKDTKKILSF